MPERRIVLLGKSGIGKSSAGNTIFGKKIFTTKTSASNAGIKNQIGERKVYGRKITVIDTPGVFTADCDEEEAKSEIVKSLIECAPAVDAFIIVLKVERYTKHENEVVQNLLNTQKDEHVLKHTVILLTHGEQLEGKTFEEFMKGCSELQELVDKCGSRCFVIDNKYWNKRNRGGKSNRVQVKKLLETIDELVKENGSYTNELLQNIGEEIQEEVKKMSEDHMPPEERHEKAKKNVYAITLKKLAGAGARDMFGALWGIKVAVACIMAITQSLNLAGLIAAGGATAGVLTGFADVLGNAVGAFSGRKATEKSEFVYNAIGEVFGLTSKMANLH